MCIVLRSKASLLFKTRRAQIVKCCGASKCTKAYAKLGGEKGIEYQRSRRHEFCIKISDILNYLSFPIGETWLAPVSLERFSFFLFSKYLELEISFSFFAKTIYLCTEWWTHFYIKICIFFILMSCASNEYYVA